jgi:hypothetical protein
MYATNSIPLFGGVARSAGVVFPSLERWVVIPLFGGVARSAGVVVFFCTFAK